jgi:mRNA interferase MazF
VNHGDIYWVKLPDRGGREQRGRRPAIIWQDTASFSRLPTVLVIPLTSRLDALRFPATTRVDPTTTNSLSTNSVALVFQLGACDIRRVAEYLGRLDDEHYQAIQQIVKRLLLVS